MNDVAAPLEDDDDAAAWHARVVGRSLEGAKRRSIDRGARLVHAAAKVLERSGGGSLTVQEVADEAGQSLRTLYQYFASKDDLLLAVYEEAMRTYARLIRAAIAGFDDPVERLAAGIIASTRMPTLHDKAGVDRALSYVRLQLGQADPDLVARSQEPVTALFRELVERAVDATMSTAMGAEQATYVIASVRTSYIHSRTLGNDYGLSLPDEIDISCFCLGGIGVQRPRAWHESIDARLELSGADGRSILRRLAKEPAPSRSHA